MNFFKPKPNYEATIADLRAQLEDVYAGQRAAEIVLEEYKAREARLLADFENFRNRTDREKRDLTQTSNARLLTQLIGVLDNLDRALEMSRDIEAVSTGIQLIRNGMWKVMTDNGVTEIDALGLVFNPEVHEALMQECDPNVAEGHVCKVLDKGYRIGERILRHSRVSISIAG